MDSRSPTSTLGYPATVVCEDSPDVPGFVFTSAALPDHWQRLDAFERDEYDRIVATATLTGGRTAKAYVYALRGPGPSPASSAG